MLDQRLTRSAASDPSLAPPFRRILCALEGRQEADTAAVEQAIAVAGADAELVFAASWTAAGATERALEQAHAAGFDAQTKLLRSPRFPEALVHSTVLHDLLVV